MKKIKPILVFLLALSLVLPTFPIPLLLGTEDYSWPMFGNKPVRTGSLENQDLISNASNWEFQWTDLRLNSPAIANGYVYYKLDHVICLNAFTGETVWEATQGVAQDIWSVVIAYGCVYADANGYVYALNASTGEEIWTYIIGNDEELYAPTVANGVVYVGCGDNNLYAFNAFTGTKIWNYSTSGKVRTSPAVVNGVVYVGSNDGNVYALDASSGTKLWNYSTGNKVQEHYGSSPAVSNGVVYIGSDGNGVYALNASTGTKIWNQLTRAVVFKTPVVAYDYVYVGVNNWFYALDASTGIEIWNFTHPGFFPEWASPAVADGVVYIGSGGEDYYSGNFYALNAYTGEQIDHIELNYRVYSTPAVAYGTVYLAATHRLYAIDTSSYISDPDLPSLDDWSEVARFTGSGSEKYASDYFTCDHEEWRIRWEYVPDSQQPDLTSFSVFTYPIMEGDRGSMYVNQIMKTGTADTNGTSFIHNYQGTFHMYIDVDGTESYTIIVEQNLNSIPEFPSWTIIPLVLIATLVLLLFKKRLSKRKSGNYL